MNTKYIIDAGALALYFAGDKRVKEYFNEIFEGKVEGYVLEINLAEFYYKTAEVLGLETAELRYRMIRNSDLRQMSSGNKITREAAIIKLNHRNILSLADSFLIAEARERGMTILTTDKAVKETAGKEAVYFKVE